MLHSWAALQVSTADDTVNARTTTTPHIETSEQHEHHLRALYESALLLYCGHRVEEAQSAFQSLVNEITTTSSSSSSSHRASKRPRTITATPPPSSQWQRRLRYVAYKNLAETCAELGQHNNALNAFTAALDNDLSDLIVWLGAARSACTVGHLHAARKAFEAALSLRAGHWLAHRPYRAVLAAIGDLDDDLDARGVGTVYVTEEALVGTLVRARQVAAEDTHEQLCVEALRLKELSCNALFDAVCTAFFRKLSAHSNLPVAYPVLFDAPLPPRVMDISNSSDDVVVVQELRAQSKRRTRTGSIRI